MNRFYLRSSAARSAAFIICISLFGGTLNVYAAETGLHNVAPLKLSDTDYSFTAKSCHLEMHVNPKIGGRVTQLTLNSQQIIKPYTCDAAYNPVARCNGSGSTFWTSPQKAWLPASWPPIPSIDGDAYSAQLNNHHLLLTGSANEIFGASVNKDFSFDDKTCAISLRYTINASRAFSVAPWEITRVPRGGIAFFPIGDNKKFSPGPLTSFTTINAKNIAWFDDTSQAVPASESGAKLIADGADGWLAYALGDTLFMKLFADATAEAIAPGEGDIEIYPGKDFLELEAQGTYTSLARDEKLPWLVQWRVVKIPASVKVGVGSKSLLEFARAQLLQH